MYRQNFPDDPGMHNTGSASQSHYSRSSRHHIQQPSSFFQNVKRYLLAVVVGFVLICVGVAVVFWNEGRAVQTSRTLDEGLSHVRSLGRSAVAFDENNNKLVHLTSELKTFKPLVDPEYGVSVECVKLKRDVEMYQWVEIEHRTEVQDLERIRTEVSYSYSQEWKANLVDSNSFSNRFGHTNPETMPVESKMLTAEEVQVGTFFLSKEFVEKVNNFKILPLLEHPKQPGIQLYSGMLYHGINPVDPKIGDVRVTFQYAGYSGASSAAYGNPDVVSIIGKQDRNRITNYETVQGDILGLLYMDALTAEAMIGRERVSNAILTWALRFAGWLLMFVGFSCWAALINTLVDWLPIVRDLVSLGTYAMSGCLAISLSLMVIALGWFWYRPILGITILLFASLPFIVALIKESRSRSTSRRNW